MLSALSVVVNAQADAQWFGILDGVQLSPRRGATRDRKPPMEKSRKAGVQHRPPQTKPTTWDPSAREPTLPYPHLPGLSPGFLFRPQTINSRCPVAIVSDGLSHYTNSTRKQREVRACIAWKK